MFRRLVGELAVMVASLPRSPLQGLFVELTEVERQAIAALADVATAFVIVGAVGDASEQLAHRAEHTKTVELVAVVLARSVNVDCVFLVCYLIAVEILQNSLAED